MLAYQLCESNDFPSIQVAEINIPNAIYYKNSIVGYQIIGSVVQEQGCLMCVKRHADSAQPTTTASATTTTTAAAATTTSKCNLPSTAHMRDVWKVEPAVYMLIQENTPTGGKRRSLGSLLEALPHHKRKTGCHHTILKCE